MIYTSWFSNTKKIKNLRQVSIALYPPKRFKGELLVGTQFSDIIPDKNLLYDYKYHNLSRSQYAIRYAQQIIDIDFKMLYTTYDNCVFLCFEPRTDFCHRHVLRFFMKKYHNLILTELQDLMMTLSEQLKKDLMDYKRTKDFNKSALVSVIIGEVQRLPNKSVGDADIIKIIKKLHKGATQLPSVESEWVSMLEKYIPPEITEDIIKDYIVNNVDMSQYEGNKRMKLIGVIMKHFEGKADGNIVRHTLENL